MGRLEVVVLPLRAWHVRPYCKNPSLKQEIEWGGQGLGLSSHVLMPFPIGAILCVS